MPKLERQLSGIYFRHKNETTGKFDNLCFEDIDEPGQRAIIAKAEPEFVVGLAIALAETINRLGEHFDISANPDL